MLVYRSSRRARPTAQLLTSLQAEVARLLANPADHDAIRDLLVAFDAFENGVLDACQPEQDALDPLAAALSESALTLAALFVASVREKREAVADGLRRLARRLAELARRPLPAALEVADAEGYAWYALFPEAYVGASRRLLAEVRPRAAVCIGIRQIGCSLSALAAAVLATAGCPVTRYTVRPRGHPFARCFRPAPELAAALRRAGEAAHYLIFDEGPGLSGSSLCCVAETLVGWGIAEERIVFFPSHDPDPAGFRSELARRRWPRHRKITVDFDPRPLLAVDGMRCSGDLAGGRWRRLLLPAAAWPPVQPQHERRKYLFRPAKPAARGADGVLAKFAGFGPGGRTAQARGERLAATGFTPPVLGRRAGFLLTRFLPGRPLAAADTGEALLERIAAYLALLRCDFPASQATAGADLDVMLRHNIAAGLGERWAARLPRMADLYSDAAASAIDGRMLPHEWLQTPAGFVKTDALDHHADHFYPGGTDIAWDLAATEIEFRLSASQAEFLRRRYAALAGDMRVERRLPFYRLAWLAFRLGYTQLAAESTAGAEAQRFRGAAGAYAARLRREIARQAAADFRLAGSLGKR